MKLIFSFAKFLSVLGSMLTILGLTTSSAEPCFSSDCGKAVGTTTQVMVQNPETGGGRAPAAATEVVQNSGDGTNITCPAGLDTVQTGGKVVCQIRNYSGEGRQAHDGEVSFEFEASRENMQSFNDCVKNRGGVPDIKNGAMTCNEKNLTSDLDLGSEKKTDPKSDPKTDSAEKYTGGCQTKPAESELSCDTSAIAAQMACEDPTNTKISDSDAAGIAGAGLGTQEVLTTLGGAGTTLAMANAGSDYTQTCKSMNKVASSLRNIQLAYAGACTAAMSVCLYSCSDVVSTIDKFSQFATAAADKGAQGASLRSTCDGASSAGSASAFSSNRARAAKLRQRCQSYSAKIAQSAQVALQSQVQMASQGNCNQVANNLVDPDCLKADAFQNPKCVGSCQDATYAAAHPLTCQKTTAVDCTLQANASSATCICRYNPMDPQCTGGQRAVTDSKGKGAEDPFANANLGATQGLDFNEQGQPKDGIGSAKGGSNSAGNSVSSPNMGGFGGAGGKGGAQPGVDPNIERGYRSGGYAYSVSGVPLSGGGGGRGNAAGNEKFNLAKFLPKGRGKDAFRSLAGMQTTGVDGITCANCTDIWTKISNQYRRQAPTLRH